LNFEIGCGALVGARRKILTICAFSSALNLIKKMSRFTWMQGEASLKGFHMGKGLFTPTTGEFESICATVDETHNCRFLTADQAAEFLGGLNSRTVSRWAREA
jgi:hypothetical protein